MWGRLLGCFGDQLLRKFGGEPPEEWVAGLSMCTAAQHERGLRRVVFGWKGAPPSLPDFMRLCRSVGTDDFDEGPSPALALPNPDTWEGDVWDIAGNNFLRGHIAKQLSADPRHYGRPATSPVMQATKHETNPNADASPEFIANVGRLVAAKIAWAADMRDIQVNGEVPSAVQIAVWKDYFQRAEAQVAT